MGFGSHATRVSARKRDRAIAPLRPPPTSPRIQRPAAKCPAVHFVVTKLPTFGPNTRRNLAAFPIASRVRRKRQRLRSNRLIESAAARFHISRYSSAAALPISPSVYHSRSRWQPSLASVGRRLATRRESLRDNFRVPDKSWVDCLSGTAPWLSSWTRRWGLNF